MKHIYSIVIFSLVLSMMFAACTPATSSPTVPPAPTKEISSPTPIATPTPVFTPTPIPTSTPTPNPKVLTLTASSDLLQLLSKWGGKYVFFVNKDTDIKTLEDLNGKSLFCNMFNIGMETALGEMGKFQAASGIKMKNELGNNNTQFLDQLAKDKNKLGFLLKTEADKNALKDNPNLKLVEFK